MVVTFGTVLNYLGKREQRWEEWVYISVNNNDDDDDAKFQSVISRLYVYICTREMRNEDRDDGEGVVSGRQAFDTTWHRNRGFASRG